MNRNIDEGGASPQLSLERPPMGRFEPVEVVLLPSRAEPHDGAGEACRPKQPAVRGQPFEILPKTCRYISPDDQFRLEIAGLFFESALQGEENCATTGPGKDSDGALRRSRRAYEQRSLKQDGWQDAGNGSEGF